ncbi:MAG TPA: Trm112 family protein [Coxiellaceae bacterium]|nr:Trm112 family protein [Coxiellaceae bacterium]
MDKKLLDVLACPLCKSRLKYEERQQELVCQADQLAYPIREGIPVMLVDEARRLEEAEKV